MPDNVQLASGPLVVATKGDAANVQHQAVVSEYLSGGSQPVAVGTGSPFPTVDDIQVALLTAMLVEMRVQNEMIYQKMQTEVEPLESMRLKYKDFPITL